MDGPPEVAGHLLDLTGPHAADRRVGVEVEARGRADRNLPRRGQVGHVAAVADLNSRRRAFAASVISRSPGTISGRSHSCLSNESPLRQTAA